MKFEMIPLYTPAAVFAAWPDITPGMEKVLDTAAGDEDKTLTLNRILSGERLLWLGFLDGKYFGYCTTYFRMTGTNPPKKILHVDHLYRSKSFNTEVDLAQAFLDEIDRFARENECADVRTNSAIKGYDRLMRKYDFFPTYTEFRRELSGK